MNPRILLVTCGNAQAGDDGFGPRLAGLLSRAPVAGVHVADLGTRPDRLLDHLDGAGYEALVIVDAARCPDLPLGAGHRVRLAIALSPCSGTRP